MLKLDSPLDFNDAVQPTCLPQPNWAPDNDPNNHCFVSGWGTLSYQGNSPDSLQWVEVPAVTNAICNQAYSDSITDAMICAGYAEGGKDSCQGDSGGPFVCLNDDGKATMTGIVSFGSGCAYAGYYGVYARVTKILGWIQTNLVSFEIGLLEFSIDFYQLRKYVFTFQGPHTNNVGVYNISTISSGCEVDSWKDDNYCDDGNNNEECEWDGGDCCGYNVNTEYCIDCECLDPDFDDTSLSTTKSPIIPSGCIKPAWAGDGFCDDINNDEECGWDGGDCCGENVNDLFCVYCDCLDPTYNIATSQNISSNSACYYSYWVNDNYCDDLNNNAVCEWDGGDCCGSDVNTEYCNHCECLDQTQTTSPGSTTTTNITCKFSLNLPPLKLLQSKI